MATINQVKKVVCVSASNEPMALLIEIKIELNAQSASISVEPRTIDACSQVFLEKIVCE